MSGSERLFLGSFSNDEGSAPVNNKPQKLQLVDINMLYKLTQKIKKTLDWKKTVLPSNMIYGFKKEDTYEPIQDEDEDEFDESRIVTKEIETKPKRKMTDVDVEPFFYEKLVSLICYFGFLMLSAFYVCCFSFIGTKNAVETIHECEIL